MDQLNQVYRCNHIIYDDTIEQFPTHITELKNLTISIGRLITSLNSTREEGDLLNYQPLFGQIEMLCFTKNIVDVNTLKEVNNELNKISTKTNYYDDMGMLVNTTFSKNNNEYIKKEYIYLDNSNKIKKESINLLNQTYEKSYTYDALGRIKTVVDTMFTNKVYGYDYRGFLIREPNITYTYDDNGNILTKGNTTFTYDENIKDKLIKVNNDEVIYSNDNLLNPIKYKNNTYKYEGRRLTKFSNGEKEYEYLYNDQGLRKIKKEDSKIINEYYYDEDRLIYEKTTKGNIKYLYDENNLLYGFIYNKQKYIYIRDVLQNILGIATEEGKVVVKYDYTAYGEIVEVYDNTNYELSKINPFRYKGYYYDEENKMYYCKTRYYVPEWCRWLNTDSPLFLDFNNIQSTNLFSYCGNDPINNVDPNGDFAIFLFVGLVVSFAIGTTASTISQCVQYGNVNWIQAGVDGLFAVASTVLAYTGIGLIGSIVAGAGMGLVQYTLDSAVFHDDFSWSGALIAIGLGALGGLASGRGAQHFKSIGSNLDDTGRTGVKAILTAFDKYGTRYRLSKSDEFMGE